MHHSQPTKPHHLRRSQGFSLIEMLVVVAVIGIIGAIGLASVSDVNDSAKMARDQRNAQNICSMFNGAKVSGIAFASATKEEILDELITGVSHPTNGMHYKFTPLTDDQKTATLAYIEYDDTQGMLKYSSQPLEAQAAAATAEPSFGPWTNFELRNNHQLAGRLDQLRAQMPNREWQWVPATPYMHDTSQIQYRDIY